MSETDRGCEEFESDGDKFLNPMRIIFLLTLTFREDYCAETEHTSTGGAILPFCTVRMFVDSNNHELKYLQLWRFSTLQRD